VVEAAAPAAAAANPSTQCHEATLNNLYIFWGVGWAFKTHFASKNV
jgi:hypothetical protein